jgi:hypothetical protein
MIKLSDESSERDGTNNCIYEKRKTTISRNGGFIG